MPSASQKRRPGRRSARSSRSCAHAAAQGVIAGEVACSERDLASHLHGGRRSVNAAGELLDKLVARHVLRLLEKGTGTAPSVFAVWHWTRWDVPWRVDRERAADRLAAFAMSEIRANWDLARGCWSAR